MLDRPTEFVCPTCSAGYKLVRVESDAAKPEREITCLRCGGPLNGRDGRFVLKYFLADKPWKQAGKRTNRR